ncbi:SMI1/KNR4 family protein [Pasteurella sp. PK-2025]|uniref:SMI1/KNR4 family protein n=1 Tax=Pasteurella sp. PK-2025 TaxID=3413133 RepID=UPI003C70D549
MKEITWKYVKALKDNNAITKLENEVKQILPEDLKQTIKEFNNGRPSFKQFDTPSIKGCEFKKLLSLNAEDTENIFGFLKIDTNIHELLPIASTPSGDLVCLHENKIVYWYHETDSVEYLANSFSEFLNSLY